MKYFKEAKNIWKTLVPKEGQADTVEGEMIRSIEKLRWEAQENGNINWDEGFELFCEFLLETLNDQKVFSENEIKEIKTDIDRLCSDEWAYIEDDLYDRLADRAVEWGIYYKGPIKRKINPKQYR
jgi:hypothetical protein